MLRVAMMTGCALLALSGCGSDDNKGTPEEQAVGSVKEYITVELNALHDAAVALQKAAPAPDANGWNIKDDAKAVAEMRTHWVEARNAYERIEGAIAVLFQGLDRSTDQRYDVFVTEDGIDNNLFDGEGVTGVHAIERILWSNAIPEAVIKFESGLQSNAKRSLYVAAAFPKNQQEARDFKDALMQRLIDDVQEMIDTFAPKALDSATAYGGVLGSMREQIEKINFAASGEDESRYAQHTLADMRANLAGGYETLQAFEPMFAAKGGDAKKLYQSIEASFERVQSYYDQTKGDSLPAVPATWNPDQPSAADQASGYGKLYSFVKSETDEANDKSLVSLMLLGAKTTGIPAL